jgi:DNA repair protein RadD
MIPRWYQTGSVDAFFDYYVRGNVGNPLICLPTGTGKSLVQALLMKTILDQWSRQRFICLTHVKELIANNAKDMREFWPQAPLGIYSAGLDQKITHAPIVYGGVASVVNNIEAFGWRDLMIVDECHLMSGKEDSRYGKVIAGLRRINPNLKVVGLTATPYRTGMGLLTEGGIFTDICYDMTSMENFNRLIREGYLSPLRPKPTGTKIDTSHVSIKGGEFDQAEADAVINVDSITESAIREILHEGRFCRCILIFATSVDHANKITARMRTYGQSCVCIHDKSKTRDEDFKAFSNHEVRICVNYNVMTTGVNIPGIDLIAVLRLTRSVQLWVQMLGRETRPVFAPGFDLQSTEGRLAAIAAGPKPYGGLVLDFTRNTELLGPINDPLIPQKRGTKGGGVAPIKICPQCGFYNHTRARMCCNCFLAFEQVMKINATAGTNELLRTEAPLVEWFDVVHMNYMKGQKKDGEHPYLRASYFCGAMGVHKFDERILLEHTMPAKALARDWWRQRYRGDGTALRTSSFVNYVPDTVDQALQLTGYLRQPRRILVELDRKKPTHSIVRSHQW